MVIDSIELAKLLKNGFEILYKQKGIYFELTSCYTPDGPNYTISDKIRVYSPTLRMFREKQPNLILEKAIVGDPSDNIPGIPRIGIKTFQKALNDRSVWDAKIEPNRSIVEKFLQIVDLSKAPANLKEEAIIQYNSRDYSEFNPQAIEMFMFENNLKEHLDRWHNDLSDINMALYKNDSMEVPKKDVKATSYDEVESLLEFINNL